MILNQVICGSIGRTLRTASSFSQCVA